ncbi:MAG: DNA internalization-related competence protein ComEC/Rec2 [Oscillospiraceae bacterium]|nr:DNA internalization-related competence protein ComEC/Rec2 [Oscillospiraceae bacterium]
MRKLVYMTLGFGAACGLWAYTDSHRWILAGCAAAVLFGAAAGKEARPLHRALLVLLGLLAGFGWCRFYGHAYLLPAKMLDDTIRNVELRASDFSRDAAYGTTFDAMLMQAGRPYRVKVYLNESLAVTPGDYLYGNFRFRMTAPEGETESNYHSGKGTFLLAYQQDTVRLEDYAPTRRDLPARIRNKVQQIITLTFPEDAAPFAKALVLGDTSDLDYATDTAFKVSGVRHVVAVSGLHVSILFALLSTLTLKRRWLTALVGYPALVLFAAVAGFTPSVCRACIMSGLLLLSYLVSREYDGPSALSFAVLVILWGNPLAITSVSFQLSVASVAGIYLFQTGIRRWLTAWFGDCSGSRIKAFFVNALCTSIAISLSAMVLTVPLCAYYFGVVSLIGPLTNLLTLWVISGIFYGICGVCGLFFLFPAAAAAVARLVAWPIRYVLGTAKFLAKFPLAAVYTQSIYIVLWLIFIYILLLYFLFSRNRRPVTLSCCACIGLCIALLAGWHEGMRSGMCFTVLDVGQGQCLLLQSEGKTVMVDCGGDSDTKAADLAAQTLLARGINRLDCLILTHLDRDHAGGAQHFLSRVDTDVVILSDVYSQLDTGLAKRVVYAKEDLQMTLGTAKIQIFTPRFPGNSNEMSLCILFDMENCDILITGDRSGFGERSLLRHAQIPDVDILVAGHHGAKNATCEELLDAVTPEIVCISVSADNSYGHPSSDTIARLQQHGCTIYRTDRHGTITIRR